MGIFDDLGKTISSAANTTAQKTKDMAEITRLNFAIGNKEDELKEVYAKLGESVCALHCDNYPEDLKEYFDKVEELKQEMAEMHRKVLLLKNVLLCTACGAENSPSSKFCSNCGAKLEHPPVAEPEVVDDEAEDGETAFEEAVDEVEEAVDDVIGCLEKRAFFIYN